MEIGIKVEVSYAHRLPNHKGDCRFLHGHNGIIQIFIEGELKNNDNVLESSMIIDFGDLKKLIKSQILTVIDHAVIVYKGDTDMKDLAFKINNSEKVLVLDKYPTAEVLAQWVYRAIEKMLKKLYFKSVEENLLWVKKVIWEETRDNVAIYEG